MGRAPCCEKIGLKRGRWTAEEDDVLIKYIQANGEGSWRSLPKNAGLLRCGKSCRLRWINYLANNLKRGNITKQEEDIIIKLHASIGNKWSFIATQLPGRTDNEIKNYWNSHLSRKIDTFRRPVNNEALPIIIDLAKKKGGRTSRATMKKKEIGKNVKESEILENKNNGALVTLSSTPSLGKEKLPSSHLKEIMGDKMLGVNEECDEARNVLLCCPTIDQHSDNDILGPSHENVKSMVGGGDQDLESVILSSNNGGGDQSSEWDSTNSYLEFDLDHGKIMDCDWVWEWEDQGLLLNDQSKHDHQEQDEMLSWLWDGETQINNEKINDQNQEALVAWLFS